jgi:hypothetical protein
MKRLSRAANLRTIAVLRVLLGLMALRFWYMGDHVSGIVLAALFLHGVVGVSLRFLRRREPPRELKLRDVYNMLAGSAVNVAIFGFVAIRSWQHDRAPLWSGICGLIALVIAAVSTFGFVMYFRFRNRNGEGTTQTAQSSQATELGGRA